jgi:tetratricopeptide (TPR) repeat protein
MEQAPDIAALEAPAPRAGVSDQTLLEEGLKGRALTPAEVAGLSERLLAEGNSTLDDEKTMARLELLLLKALKGGEDKASSPMLWRNLGIIHFHQKKYDRAQQELKKANEFNPRDARTHFYLARLLTRQAEICQRKGLKKKSRGLFKQAATEMELARKFAPNNPTYRQDLKQIKQPEPGP